MTEQERTYRTSPAQDWILAIERLRFLKGVQLSKVLRLPDGMSERAMREATCELFQRQTALRTLIERRAGRFQQRIVPVNEDAVRFERVAGERHAPTALSEIMTAEAADPIDPRRLPARARLLSAGPVLRLMVITAHHASADWWALETAADQITAYASDGQPIDCPMVFAEYAEMLADPEPAVTEYWTAALRGAEPVKFPGDGSAGEAGEATSRLMCADAARTADVRALAARCRTTPFTVLLTAFAIALGRWTGQDDFLISTQLANRGRPELQRLVGCLTTTVPLRMTVPGGRPFAESAAAAQRMSNGAHRHGRIDFGQVMRACGLPPESGPARSPSLLFQAIPAGGCAPAPPGELAAAARPRNGLPVDLHVGVSWSGDRLRCEADFNDGVLAAGTVATLMRAFAHVLGIACEDPTASVGRIRTAIEEATETSKKGGAT